MPFYRLVFPTPPDIAIENARTAHIEIDRVLEVGDLVEHGGKRWRVSEAPVEQPESGEMADLMVWPVDD